MHEWSLLADLMGRIEQVARAERARRVVAVRVTLGPLAHISAAHLREHFARAARGTVSEGARLEVEALSDPDHPHAGDIRLDSIEVA